MHPAEVEMGGEADDRAAVIFQLAADSHRFEGESAVEQAQRKVSALRLAISCRS
jgi:hypothetical protein